MTRQIVLDTETTGLHPDNGDRIVEIGCVELFNRRPTGRTLHYYVNPERDSDPGALEVHGLTREFLGDKPRFEEIYLPLIEFLQGAELLIHNAPFDEAFLDAEFSRLSLPRFRMHCRTTVVDTLAFAKELHPGKRNSLDALCERYQVSNAHRVLHGALLDAQLLAEVYLAMTRGQESLVIEMDTERTVETHAASSAVLLALPVVLASDEELAAHELLLNAIAKEVKGEPVWRRAAEITAAAAFSG
jgi:DNA polymerase-3 subunit epsilon